jgi:hypothetical protein
MVEYNELKTVHDAGFDAGCQYAMDAQVYPLAHMEKDAAKKQSWKRCTVGDGESGFDRQHDYICEELK